MSIIIVTVLSVLIGLIIKYATRKKQYFQFKVSPFIVGSIISSITYYVFNFQFFLLDSIISNQNDWSEGMAIMVIEDGFITAILYTAIIFALTDQVLLRLERLKLNYKCIITGILTIGVFIFVLSNEVSESSTFKFSPTFWGV